MREALARSDLDFVLHEPDGAGRHDGDVNRLPRILRLACMSTAAIMCGVIVVNALFLQDRRHPAPLLRVPNGPAAVSAPETLAPAPSSRAVVSSPVLQPGPDLQQKAARDPIGDAITKMSAPVERKTIKVTNSTSTTTSKTDGERVDPIASLIGSAQPASSPEVSGLVLAAQKALLRLGYVVRADGRIGATTKQAIEHYERDNHLPAHGDLTPKLARELSAKAGIAGQ